MNGMFTKTTDLYRTYGNTKNEYQVFTQNFSNTKLIFTDIICW